jgi:hypothetical protein
MRARSGEALLKRPHGRERLAALLARRPPDAFCTSSASASDIPTQSSSVSALTPWLASSSL